MLHLLSGILYLSPWTKFFRQQFKSILVILPYLNQTEEKQSCRIFSSDPVTQSKCSNSIHILICHQLLNCHKSSQLMSGLSCFVFKCRLRSQFSVCSTPPTPICFISHRSATIFQLASIFQIQSHMDQFLKRKWIMCDEYGNTGLACMGEPKPTYACLAFQLPEYLLITFMVFFHYTKSKQWYLWAHREISSAQTKKNLLPMGQLVWPLSFWCWMLIGDSVKQWGRARWKVILFFTLLQDPCSECWKGKDKVSLIASVC